MIVIHPCPDVRPARVTPDPTTRISGDEIVGHDVTTVARGRIADAVTTRRAR
jgi:hypothetical protein